MEVTCTSSKKLRVVSLPDELVTEILARVPYRSLCQFKCVSRTWRKLCSEPTVLRRCPQTLSGFFFGTFPFGRSRYARHFVNASGRGPPMVDPSMSFLPPGYSDSGLLDSCNGLLLCNCGDTHLQPQVAHSYFVCNPATKKWMGLPDPKVPAKTSCIRVFRLGFDPTMSSHFRVFMLESERRFPGSWDQVTTGVEIFSSETGAWSYSYRKSEWGDQAVVGWLSVFFKGILHLTSAGSLSLFTVDMDGKVWGKIPAPHDFSYIRVSQGRLHGVHIRNRPRDHESIGIWVLEDYAGQRWTLKHAVTAMQMFGARPTSFGDYYTFIVNAIHPEHGMIFMTAGKQRSLMSYDMDNKKVRFISTLGGSSLYVRPYVPCFSDKLSDQR